jgi:hypothetical protein
VLYCAIGGCNALMGGATCRGGIWLDVDGLSSAHHGAEGVAAGKLAGGRAQRFEQCGCGDAWCWGVGGAHGLLLWKL